MKNAMSSVDSTPRYLLLIPLLLALGLYACTDEGDNYAAESKSAVEGGSTSPAPVAAGETNPAAHPNLLIGVEELPALQAADPEATPLFHQALERARARVGSARQAAVDVPLPADPGGGYTHERHKRNALLMYEAAQLFAIDKDQKARDFAHGLLLEYAALYPKLPLHPARKNQAPGKLFWQILNDAWWLTYVIQAYDMLFVSLSEQDRAYIEQNLLRPYVDFLSVQSANTFNKVHNHGTWAAAAVGMTGLVLADDHYVEIALKGLDKSGDAGFLKQLEQLFSPDGYYTEGPYYQRYALLPFVKFARALDRQRPDLDIFGYRDGVLIKAIYAAIQLTDGHYFLPLNDAIKDKGLDTIEMVYGVDIAYAITGDTSLLAIAEKQNQVVLTGDGLKVAKDLAAGLAVDFGFSSQLFRDGPRGDEGAVALLRDHDLTLVFKAASQGMGHGHFDRLGWQLYDAGTEIVSDYGAARYLNVEPKRGGIYLPENTSWAKQTVAHNALVVDGQSHFDGQVKPASAASPELLHFAQGDNWQLVQGREASAYEDVIMSRTLALISLPGFDAPIVLDIMQADAKGEHDYDLPLHFQGQLMTFSGEVSAAVHRLEPLGAANGYQHLWRKASVSPKADQPLQASWLANNRFYTLTSVAPAARKFLVGELGANDPEFNLRREQTLITRVAQAASTRLVSIIEPHGHYDGRAETVSNPRSNIVNADYRFAEGIHHIELFTREGQLDILVVDQPQAKAEYTYTLGARVIQWRGALAVTERATQE